MPVLVITGTGTEVGKTITTAAVAAAALAAGRTVAVLKPAQTGLRPDERGDADEVARLAGAVTTAELARYPEPLAPGTAARRAGMTPVRPHEVAEAAQKLATEHDLVLVEGAGGLLVRFDEEGGTLADAARLLNAPVLVVASERDYTPVAFKQAYASRLRDARLVELADSGHLASLDQPVRLAEAALAFLAEVEGAGGVETAGNSRRAAVAAVPSPDTRSAGT